MKGWKMLKDNLKQQIVDIEDSILPIMSTQDLYDNLIKAYSLQKDLIELLEGNVEEVSSQEMEQLTKDNIALTAEVDRLQQKLDNIKQQLD
jgi:uncharacterized protein YdcH (DUF465 family)